MISDKQRREVAERMRSKKPEEFGQLIAQSVFRHVFRSLYPKQIYPVSNWVLRMPYALADLIDRPTCHDVGGGYEFRCSGCGCAIHIYRDGGFGEDDSAMTVGGDSLYVPHYCPNCGAEVAE